LFLPNTIMFTQILSRGILFCSLLTGLVLMPRTSTAAPAVMDASGRIAHSTASGYEAQVSSFAAAPVLTISATDYTRGLSSFAATWMVQAATNSPNGCTIYVSGTPTGTMPLEHFYIKAQNLHAKGALEGSTGAIPVPAVATPIWSSTDAHSNGNAFSLDLEVRELGKALAGHSGVMLTFRAVPNS
jgi:hypothetical protein